MSNTGIRNIHKIRSQTGYAIEITNQRKKYVAYAKTLEEAMIWCEKEYKEECNNDLSKHKKAIEELYEKV